MCGIAGFAGAGNVDDLRRMTQALAHRGPDSGGSAVDPDNAVWLGHRRLVVVDPEGGEQPMWSADRSIVVAFNGEIYDAPELRKELESCGCVFRSHHSDTEILIHGYLEWGVEFVERLNGMWAFALWDRRRRRLLLSRDRFGQKPLYWAQRPGLLAFASELEALANHSQIERALSREALRKFFAYGWVPAPGSMLQGVHKLHAGANLEIDLPDGRLLVRRWWDFRLEPEPPGRPLQALGEELREKLARAVSRRLVADVPVGVFLSGGIDSSALAHFAAARLEPGALHTFAMSFEEPSFDESAHAERAAQHVGSQHRCTSFSMRAAREILPAIADRLDEPLGDASLLPTYLLCGVARREVTVALGGDGGDELFAGYDPFRALRLANLYRRIVPRPVHAAIRLLAARLPTSHRYMSFEFRLKRTLRGLDHPPALWNPVWMGPLEPREIAEFLAEPVDVEEVYAEAIAAWDSCADGHPVDRTLQFFTRLYLQDDILAKVDRASMLNSLEVRSPFLDIELVDFVRRLPHTYKLRRGTTKFLLRRALRGVLPREILERPKQGFAVPMGQWLEGSLPPFDRIEPIAYGTAARFLQHRLQEHRSGQADHRLFLYPHWLLSHWLARGAPTPN